MAVLGSNDLLQDPKLSAEGCAQRMGIDFADAGAWNISLAFDGVHFSEAGHQAFAKGIEQILSRMAENQEG